MTEGGLFGRQDRRGVRDDRMGLFGMTECVQNNRIWPLSFRVKGGI